MALPWSDALRTCRTVPDTDPLDVLTGSCGCSILYPIIWAGGADVAFEVLTESCGITTYPAAWAGGEDVTFDLSLGSCGLTTYPVTSAGGADTTFDLLMGSGESTAYPVTWAGGAGIDSRELK